MAIVGGFVLSALVGIVVLSIIGRELNAALHGDFFQSNMKGLADWLLARPNCRASGATIKLGPVNGDYEIVEAGMAFTIFSFLPLAQITGAHATVDIFTQSCRERHEPDPDPGHRRRLRRGSGHHRGASSTRAR